MKTKLMKSIKSNFKCAEIYLIHLENKIEEVKYLLINLEKHMSEKFIQEAIKHPGALRKSLHVKKGEKIPEKKLEKAAHSKNPTTRKRAVLAETLKKMHK